MPTLTLKQVTLHQFKHIHSKPLTIPLSPHTIIRGDMRTGKTSIAEAVIFTLFGTTPTKSPSVDAWFPPNRTALRAEVTLMGFDQQTHTIVRERTRSKTTIVLDGLTCPNQDALTPIIGTVDQFQPAFFPLTMTQWKSTEARQFWTQLLPPIEPETVLAVLGDTGAPLQAWTPTDFAAMDLTLEQTQKTIKQQTAERERLIGAISLLDHMVTDAESAVQTQAAIPVDPATEEAVHAAEAALAAITPPTRQEPDWAPYYQAISQAEAQVAASQQTHPTGWEDPAPYQARMDELDALLAEHPAPILPSDATVQALRQQYQQITERVQSLTVDDRLPQDRVEARQAAHTALTRADMALAHHDAHPPNPPPTHPTCPTCHQALPPAEQQRVQADYQTARTAWNAQRTTLAQAVREAQRALDACDAQDAQVRETAKAQTDQQRATFEAQRQTVAQEGQHAAAAYHAACQAAQNAWDVQHTGWVQQREAAQRQRDAIQTRNAQLPQIPLDTAETALAQARQHLARDQAAWAAQQADTQRAYQSHIAAAQTVLQTAHAAHQQAQHQRDALIQAQTQCAALHRQHDTQTALLAEVETALLQLRALTQAIAAFQQQKTELEVQPLRDALHCTEIALWKQNKTTGTLKPIFQLTYDQRPMDVISTSERMDCAAELTFALSRLTDTVYPVFLDNAESSTQWPAVPGQRITAEVKAHLPLTIVHDPQTPDLAAHSA